MEGTSGRPPPSGKRTSHNAKGLTSERLDSNPGHHDTHSRWILLDFLSAPGFHRPQTHFACWIFVGFRAALNVCSHPHRPRKRALTCSFAWWAVTGSNRRPLRCKRMSGMFFSSLLIVGCPNCVQACPEAELPTPQVWVSPSAPSGSKPRGISGALFAPWD